MNVQEILQLIGISVQRNWLLLIAGLSLIQIAPIKINPWSWLGKWAGKMMGVKDLSDKIDALEKKVDENDAIRIRKDILKFGDEVRVGHIEHSKESFDQVLDDITSYEQYCKDHPKFENNRTVLTTKVIKDTYHKLYVEHRI